jgi:hypothetical protein
LLVTANFHVFAHVYICALHFWNHYAVAVGLDDVGQAFVLALNLRHDFTGKRLVTGQQAGFVLFVLPAAHSGNGEGR